MSARADFPANARGVSASPSASSLSVAEAEHFEKLLSLFCAHLRGTHGLAKSTVRGYRSCLGRAVRDVGHPPWNWISTDIDVLLAAHAERGLALGTQNGTITVLRSFQNYLLGDVGLCNECQRKFGVRPQQFITLDNSIPYRRQGRKSSRVRNVPTREQCANLLAGFKEQIVNAAQKHSKSYNPLRRDYVMTVVALSYGLRLDELCHIETPHFIPDPRYPRFGRFAILRVVGKGRKLRAVRLYAPTGADVLGWYVDEVRSEFLTTRTKNPNLLFLSERGCRLCPRQYRRRLANVAQEAGLPLHVNPHLLRHAYATHMMNVIGATALQEQLGHEYLSTTLDTYYHPDPERVGHEVALAIDAVTSAVDQVTQEATRANHR